jgi:hypothetical protein
LLRRPQWKPPPSVGNYPIIAYSGRGQAGNGEGGFFFHLLPYVEQGNLYSNAITFQDGFNLNGVQTYSEYGSPNAGYDNGSNPGTFVQNKNIKVYDCPSDPTNTQQPTANGPWQWNCASYAINGQVFTGHRWNIQYGRFPSSITDGTSQTIFFTEKQANSQASCPGQYCGGYNYWADWGAVIGATPNVSAGWGSQPGGVAAYPQFNVRPLGSACFSIASSSHTGVILTGMGDASVRNVAQGISATTWWAAMTPSNGDILGNDW